MIIGVGIGPGDPDWLTQRGAKLIREAEWIVGFRTVNGFVQEMISESADEWTRDYIKRLFDDQEYKL